MLCPGKEKHLVTELQRKIKSICEYINQNLDTNLKIIIFSTLCFLLISLYARISPVILECSKTVLLGISELATMTCPVINLTKTCI